jgi:large subunit ribosomal protein L28
MPLPRDSSVDPSDQSKKKKSKSPATNESAPSSASSDPSSVGAPLAPRDYRAELTAAHLSQLAENEHHRYPPNSDKIAHAVILESDGKKTALQFEVPDSAEGMPAVRPITNIEEIEPFRGMHRYQAITPGGTEMYAKRFIFGEAGDATHKVPITVACFSPSDKPGKQPFWGSIKPTPLFRSDLSRSDKKELDAELKEIGKVSKGGVALVIDNPSVPQRDLMKTRTPDQNTVMGESARDAYENFFDKLSDELSSEMVTRLKRSFQADIKAGLFKNSYRPEWLHAYGWSLAPLSMNPQTQENLGAAPKWVNTQMMILERIVKWFAINCPESQSKIKANFDMLLDSELIERVNFETNIELQDRYVKWVQDIDPFLAFPLFPKASDIAQGTAVTYSLVNSIPPLNQQEVKLMKKSTLRPSEATSSGRGSDDLAFLVSSASLPRARVLPKESLERKVKKSPHVSYVESESSPDGFSPGAVDAASAVELPDASLKSRALCTETKSSEVVKKITHPTQQKNYKSVVQVYSTSLSYDYDTPWRSPEEQACSGSGVIIEHGGKFYILTNAHVAENAIYLQVRLANDRKRKYEAKPKCVSYQCDLALLEVDDPEFQALAEPAVFGDMVSLETKVMTVGFPMGGSEISVSKGITSRIEVRDYVMSGLNMLQVQIDAAVNSGNSGGPVFSVGKVVGIAFQAYGLHGLGYMIPIPIINHFLTEAFSGKPYRGFPILPYDGEELENADEREFYNLGDRTGVRVKKINNLCDAYLKLKPEDILLSIDGHIISNEGTVDIPGIGDCIDLIHVTHSKHIGDTVNLEVLRKDPETGLTSTFNVDVLLDSVPGDTEKVGVSEQDKMASYYINSGLCFVPLTRNYLEGDGGVFEEVMILEEGCTLPEVAKKFPGEQIVVMSHILACKETQGYDKHVNEIVKEINGQPIKHINDVIKAMEENKHSKHVITLNSKSKVIIPKMSAEQLQALLDRHRIPAARSKDLMAPVNEEHLLNQPMSVDVLPVASVRGPAVASDQGREKTPKKRVLRIESSEEDEIVAESESVRKKVSASSATRPVRESMKRKQRIESLADEDEVNSSRPRKKLVASFIGRRAEKAQAAAPMIEDDLGRSSRGRRHDGDIGPSAKRKAARRSDPFAMAAGLQMPGLKRYMGLLDDMEAHYEEQGDEDEEVDFDKLSEHCDSDEVTTEDEDQGEDMDLDASVEAKPSRPLLQRRNAMVPSLSFFGSSARRHADKSDEDLSRSHGKGAALL